MRLCHVCNEEKLIPIPSHNPDKYYCAVCDKSFPKEEIELSSKEVEKVRSIFDNKDIIEDKELENLQKLNSTSGTNQIDVSKLFLQCYDYLFNNMYLLQEEKKIDEKLFYYLKGYDFVSNIRKHLEDYGDGNEFGSHREEYHLTLIVDKNREDINFLIQLFFKFVGDEE